jgi:hypothetical protein
MAGYSINKLLSNGNKYLYRYSFTAIMKQQMLTAVAFNGSIECYVYAEYQTLNINE